MPEDIDLKGILHKLRGREDSQVTKQLVDQSLAVKLRMGPVKRKIVVLSGKGGVGKSMVTANLALAFARKGARVGILDVDLNGPCIPHMLGMSDQRFAFTEEGVIPPRGPLDLKVASMAFFLAEGAPVRWAPPMDLSPIWLGALEMGTIRELLADVVWGELDFLFADLPPGAAADKPPVLVSLVPELDGAVVVTTPSSVARAVVGRSIQYVRDLGIPLIGLIENMSGSICHRCGANLNPLEGDAAGPSSFPEVPFLGRIPWDGEISRACDRGVPLMDPEHPMVRRFDSLAEGIQKQLDLKREMAEKILRGEP
ncbi:MAG: P-loop NTPase [Acidobacteria bacterium]|nr:P-loop NTPase [Acidobacteriota bacterium]